VQEGMSAFTPNSDRESGHLRRTSERLIWAKGGHHTARAILALPPKAFGQAARVVQVRIGE